MQVRVISLALLMAAAAAASVQNIRLKERTDVLNGKAFGPAGPYERIAATVHFRLDPKLEQNRGIVDLSLAPKDADGYVNFSADLLVFKPTDPAKGNGTAIIDVVNRGRPLAIGTFNRAVSALDPKTPEEIGDGLLMQSGFTVVSIGWQWDTPEVPGRIGLQAPRLPASITGIVRAEYVPDKTVNGFSLGDRDHTPYPVFDEKDSATRLYVSDAPGKPRREIPRARWRFVNKTAVEIDGGCEAGKIYEVVYRGTGAVPVGLGFAAVRDIASFMKYGESPFLLGDQKNFIKRTIAFGVSQTGRFLRHMMYEGFNEDEKSRQALDGVWAHVGGSGRGGFNHRFAQPSRDGQPLLHYSWPVDIFPFADSELRDPITGKQDGLLTRVTNAKFAPKIFYSNNSYEYWGRSAALIHTTPDGARDVDPVPNTRIYFFTGGQHGAGSLPLKRNITQNVENPLDFRWGMRALLIAFHEWLKDGKEPPASAFPTLAASQLAPPGQLQYPGRIHPPASPRVAHVLDFSTEPPKSGAAYPLLVPKVDKDGNEVGGVRMPELDVPLGAYAGWNLRAASIGSPDQMIAFIGSFFQFDAPEIKKRYPSKDAYLASFRKAAEQLAEKRYALRSDVDGMVERGGKLWDATQ